MANSNKPNQPVDQEKEALQKELARLQSENDQLKAENAHLADGPTMMPANGSDIALQTSTKGKLWRFEVAGRTSVKGKPVQLSKMEIEAVDESEAKRLYTLLEDRPDGSRGQRNRPLNPSTHSISVVCLDEKERKAAIRGQYKTGGVPGDYMPAGAK